MSLHLITLDRPAERLAALMLKGAGGWKILDWRARQVGFDLWSGSGFWGRLQKPDPKQSQDHWFVDLGLSQPGLLLDKHLKFWAKQVRENHLHEGLMLPLQIVRDASIQDKKGFRVRPFLPKDLSQAAQFLGQKSVQREKSPSYFLDLRDPETALAFEQGLQPRARKQASDEQVTLLREAWARAPQRVVSFGKGHLIIEQTAAATCIDVNGSGGALDINFAACRWIADLMRERNLGGQVLIDFIAMDSKAERQAVLVALKQACTQDLRRLDWGTLDGFSCLMLSRARQGPSRLEYETLSADLGPPFSFSSPWPALVESPRSTLIEQVQKLVEDKRSNRAWAKPTEQKICIDPGFDEFFLQALRSYAFENAKIDLRLGGD